MSTRKPFDRDLYNENNERAIDAVLAELTDEGLYAVRNDDLYGPDIVVYKGFRPFYYVEVEVKRVWPADSDFPWPTIHLPERKSKFLRLGKPIEFWILRSDLTETLVVPDVIINSNMLHIVPNRLVGDGEQFYVVPVAECINRKLGSTDDSDKEETTPAEEMG